MSDLHALRIAPAAAGTKLGRDQQKFNTLIHQIEQARKALRTRHDKIAEYRQAHASKLQPLLVQLRSACRQWVFGLDAAAGQHGWTRAERDTLSELVCEAAAELLAADDTDTELKALFDRHSEVDFDTWRQQDLDMFKGLAEELMGVDLEEDDGDISEEEFMRRLDRQMDAQAEAAAARHERKAARRKTVAQQRHEKEQQAATQSLREVFRKLASALHPDRETDPGERAAKTELMQQVNQAYAKADLLALLELQLRIEQVDAAHVANMDAPRLRRYNKLLAEQLDELSAEIMRVDMEFSIDFGLDPMEPVHPRKLGELLQRQARSAREELARLERRARMLKDMGATRRWLKTQRQRLQRPQPEFDPEDFF